MISFKQFNKGFFILLATLAVLFSFKKPKNIDVNKISVSGGFISGTKDSAGEIYIFKGIPFAAPPTGNLRWRPPQQVLPWAGIKKCDHFGASPMQGAPMPFSMWSKEFLIPSAPISEDCLYLNIWSGAKSTEEKRPVLVWIYGGGFSSGGSSVPIYDGEAMAKKGIVFISINYRVGVFGFFASSALTKESGNHASGNYGLMDQVAALTWVQKNISAFGGDPQNVTVAGQSAGSMSVNCLVASPLAKNLFTKAIAESGANFTNSYQNLQAAETDGNKLAQTFGTATLQQLRAIPADVLLKKAQGIHFPIIDGYVLPEPIIKIFSQNKENKVSLLTGWNQDDGILFGAPKNAVDYKKETGSKYKKDSAQLLNFYPAGSDSEAAASQLNMSRDNIFGIQNYTWANIAASQNLPVYLYRFARKPPATGEYVKFGAFHTAEVPYAYGNLAFFNRRFLPEDFSLEAIMLAYWSNFIKTGNPNGAGLPEWNTYNRADKSVMILDADPHTKPLSDSAALNFLYAEMSR